MPGAKFGGALRESALAALVALLLAIPLVGLRLTEGLQGLGIETRFDWVAWGVGIVFFGRLGLALSRGSRGDLLGRMPAMPKFPTGTGSAVAGLLLVLAVAMPLLPVADRYMVEIAITVLIYVMLGWGLNIVVGLAGLLDLGYVAFYAVGAYTYALLAINFDISFWLCLPIAGLFAALFGIILGFPVLRLRGDYLAIVTLGFGEMIRIVLLNWKDFSGGPNGISSIPRPDFFGFPFARDGEGQTTFHELFGLEFSPMHRIVFLYYLILILALLTNWFTLRMRKLPVGRAWEALREDEIACRALGINPTNVKLSAFALGAMFGGFAGAFFATRQGFISPESFSFIESAVILAIVVLGGMGSQMGVVIAAAFLILVPELLRDFSQYRMVLFGMAMVLIMLWRPQGLVSHRAPSARLEAGT